MSVPNILYFLVSSLMLLLAMSFPQKLYFGAFVFLIPILFWVEKKHATDGDKKIKTGFVGMFLFSFLFSLGASSYLVEAYPLNWYANPSPALSLVIIGSMWFLFGLFMSIPGTAWIYLSYKDSEKSIFWLIFVAGTYWIFLEYLRSWLIALSSYGPGTIIGPHYTYYSLGYLAAEVPVIKNLLPIGGLYFASFYIIVVNYFVYKVIFNFRSFFKTRSSLLVTVFIVVVPTVSSVYMNRLSETEHMKKTHPVVVVNSHLSSKFNEKSETERRELAKEVIKQIKSKNTLVFFPENIKATPDNLEEVTMGDINLIASSYRDGGYYRLSYFDPKSKTVDFYDKQLLMPISEYEVYFITFFLKLFNNPALLNTYFSFMPLAKKNSSTDSYIFQRDKSLVIGGALCSENISPYIYQNFTKQGATLFINLASHAILKGSPLLERQTLAINTTRALENGRYIITASNFGASFIIDDRGNPREYLFSGEKMSFFESEIEEKFYKTPYVKYGDWILIVLPLILFFRFVFRKVK